MPEPLPTGTICAQTEDYVFDACNAGPGLCTVVESQLGSVGMCVGIPVNIGDQCNDLNQCTKNDKCEVVTADDGLLRGVCVGTFDAAEPCRDYDDQCTFNDR
jgi:hypothetical protein